MVTDDNGHAESIIREKTALDASALFGIYRQTTTTGRTIVEEAIPSYKDQRLAW